MFKGIQQIIVIIIINFYILPYNLYYSCFSKYIK